KDCGLPPPGITSTGFANGDNTATYTCDEGHIPLSGKAEISCLASGLWETDILICQPKDCGPLPLGTLSTGFAKGGTKFPNTATYTCDEGHTPLSGNTEIFCLASGQWLTNVLICQPKDCGLPPPGILSTGFAKGGTTFPNTASYTCYVGHTPFSGKAEISCLASGLWEIDILICKPKDCGLPPPGVLSTGFANGGTTFPYTATYACDEGHTPLS
ncbi:hypothetical protein LOTGIDRAFT_239773, partial [Lottia gigantea]